MNPCAAHCTVHKLVFMRTTATDPRVSARARLALLLALAAGLFGHAGVAAAAAPTPGTDSLAVVGSAALDVLNNDSDADADPLTVTGHSGAAHGAVACAPTGACQYTVNGSYTGADSFTYTVSDGSSSADGTVNVTVSAPSGTASTLAAGDDRAVTKAGTAVHIDVLANDAGPAPLTVTGATTPAHGTATCSPTGGCDYTPAAGYTGSDGFFYTLQDGGSHTTTGLVTLAVVPADAAFAVGLDATPTGGVEGGSDAFWRVGLASSPAALTGEELSVLTTPALTASLDGSHALKAGSVKTAAGWTAGGTGADSRAVTATPGNGALVGDARSTAFPRPLPPVSQGTGGDGHVPILVGTKVFAFFHHSHPTSVTCVDRRTGQVCPGYPHTLNVGSSDIIGPAAVVGTRMYVHALLAGPSPVNGPLGLYCWDAATDASCGIVIVARTSTAGDPGGSAPVLAGGKIYMTGDPGQLYCVDPATNDLCAVHPTIPTGLSTTNGGIYDIVTHGTRVFVSRASDKVACLDVAAATTCSGWDTPKNLSNWNLVNQHDASGAAVGVCAVVSGSGKCVRDDDPGTVTTLTGWPTTDDYYQTTEEAETGVRTLVGSLSHSGLACWDWSTLAPCTGGGYDSGGWLNQDISNNYLPSAYGATFDGSCVVALGDPGKVFTVDPAGSAPCTSLGTGAQASAVDLRDQRCDGTVGGGRWKVVRLLDTASGELSRATVVVKDASTGAVLAQGDVTSGTLDLSGIDPAAHPALVVDATSVSANGTTPWDDAIPPRVRLEWTADPQPLCFATTTAPQCAAGDGSVGVSARAAGVGAAADRRLTVRHSTSCAVAVAVKPTGADLLTKCAKRPLVLEDVVASGTKVKLLGVAEKSLAGKTVDLVFAATGKVVAHAKVGANGRFAATAPLPPRALRRSSKARYEARIGKVRSLTLKLERRMQVLTISSKGGVVRITGRVVAPFARRAADRVIRLQRQVSCGKLTTVAKVTPKANGTFSVSVKAPAGESAAVYRLATNVALPGHPNRVSPTFTLPRAIDF